MLYALVAVVMLFCGIQAIRAVNLMHAALWLACVSALMAALLYGLGAQAVAVIELSVGAGLVTVLFVFAISMAGDAPIPERPVVPKLVALTMVGGFAALIVLFSLPLLGNGSPGLESAFADVFWHERSADAIAQVVLIFTGALTVLGWLAEPHSKPKRVFTAETEAALRKEQRL